MNDEGNRAILDRYVGTIQCPSREQPESNVTQYVAVVGEGTLWPGTVGQQLPASAVAIGRDRPQVSDERRPRILLVEWPVSDIEWTQPRDVSMEDFLSWFGDRRDATITSHGNVILYLGDDLEVHELPIDTEPSKVRELLTGDIESD